MKRVNKNAEAVRLSLELMQTYLQQASTEIDEALEYLDSGEQNAAIQRARLRVGATRR